MNQTGNTTRIQDLDAYLHRALAGTAFGESLGEDMESRRLLGRFIAAQIPVGPTLVLDAGTTSYAIAGVLSEECGCPVQHVLTNNLAIELRLTLQKVVTCTALGGRIDVQHFCTLPDPERVRRSLNESLVTAVVTAASVKISEGRIILRARRPDQFPFKRAVLSTAATAVIAFEAEKLTRPFDGIYDLPVEVAGATVIVSNGSEHLEAIRELEIACSNAGHQLHLVHPT